MIIVIINKAMIKAPPPTIPMIKNSLVEEVGEREGEEEEIEEGEEIEGDGEE